MESVVLCLLGCLIGVILSYLVIYGMAGFLTSMDIVISVKPGAVLLAPPSACWWASCSACIRRTRRQR